MKNISIRSAVLLTSASIFILIASSVISAQTLKADYQFQGNLNSSVGAVPALTNLVGAGNGPNTFAVDQVDGFSRQVLNFPLNNGVAVPDLAPILTNQNTFTLVLLFKMGALSGRRRLSDYSGGTQAGQGAFLLDGRFESESTSNPAFTPGTYVQIVYIRGGGTFKAYRDGVLRSTETDTGVQFANGFRFFQDYINNPVLASGGSIARLRFYDGAMTDDQVAAIDRVPEVASGTMPLLTASDRFGYPNRFRMNTDGTSQKRLTSGSGIEFLGRFSPNGQKIVYMQRPNPSTPPSIWISNSDGSSPVQLTSGTNDQSPSWRPDGQKIIFSRCTPPVCDIYTMNPDGSGVAALTAVNTVNSEEFARYTPDGTKIVFMCSLATNNLQLCTANADGSNRVQITNVAAPIFHRNLDISPEGTKIMCIRGTDASTNRITIMNLDGSQTSQLTLANNIDTPIWSPNGTQIAYSRLSIGSTRELHIANADGSGETRITFNSMDDTLSDWYRPQTIARVFGDFDGDGKTDLSIYRPSLGQWWWTRSSNGITTAVVFGSQTDIITPGDFTGDGKTDHAIFRPSNGQWFVLRSEDFSYYALPFGTAGDVPTPAFFDADNKTDIAVYRPSSSTWYISNSAGGTTIQLFGIAGDVPIASDYDGDGRADIAIYRPNLGQWWLQRTTAGNIAYTFGNSTDKIVPGDYTGDGKADVALWRPSTGEWFVLRSENTSFYAFPFGANGDLPIPGDYDGDGKIDASVFRPSNATWYLNRTTAGVAIQQFGANGDQPIPNAYVR